MNRPALDDRQIARMAFRISMFARRGLALDAAERLADQLADRDHERDDRRVCIECRHIQRDGRCAQAKHLIPPVDVGIYRVQRDTLQRCNAFDFQLPA